MAVDQQDPEREPALDVGPAQPGEQDQPAQPSVLFVHGIRSSGTMWRAQLEHLEALGVTARAIDLPGHGTHISSAFSLAACREVIEQAWQELPAGRRILVGLSLGGYLALDWAARTASPVDAVLAAGCSVRPRGAPLAAYRRLAGLINRLPDRGGWLNDTLTTRMLSPDAARDVAAGGVALEVMVPALTAIAQVDPIADLRRIEAPVWLVNGAWDHFRAEQARFWAAVRTGRLIVLPRTGHLVSLERPDLFNAVLAALVAQVRESGPDLAPSAGPDVPTRQ
ncbi:alpha/beta fold hydrolase [Pseudactinotalea sp. Z1748]|uniref:alpha/beta fold hydrolase n=1 Tax=Pseudactinotalea sp. Z1748 TaxID=3413027 RepID=UPI003C7E0F37